MIVIRVEVAPPFNIPNEVLDVIQDLAEPGLARVGLSYSGQRTLYFRSILEARAMYAALSAYPNKYKYLRVERIEDITHTMVCACRRTDTAAT